MILSSQWRRQIHSVLAPYIVQELDFQEVAGTTVYDLSSKGNDAAYSGITLKNYDFQPMGSKTPRGEPANSPRVDLLNGGTNTLSADWDMDYFTLLWAHRNNNEDGSSAYSGGIFDIEDGSTNQIEYYGQGSTNNLWAGKYEIDSGGSGGTAYHNWTYASSVNQWNLCMICRKQSEGSNNHRVTINGALEYSATRTASWSGDPNISQATLYRRGFSSTSYFDGGVGYWVIASGISLYHDVSAAVCQRLTNRAFWGLT